jgi:hypothetical protein
MVDFVDPLSEYKNVPAISPSLAIAWNVPAIN